MIEILFALKGVFSLIAIIIFVLLLLHQYGNSDGTEIVIASISAAVFLLTYVVYVVYNIFFIDHNKFLWTIILFHTGWIFFLLGVVQILSSIGKEKFFHKMVSRKTWKTMIRVLFRALFFYFYPIEIKKQSLMAENEWKSLAERLPKMKFNKKKNFFHKMGFWKTMIGVLLGVLFFYFYSIEIEKQSLMAEKLRKIEWKSIEEKLQKMTFNKKESDNLSFVWKENEKGETILSGNGIFFTTKREHLSFTEIQERFDSFFVSQKREIGKYLLESEYEQRIKETPFPYNPKLYEGYGLNIEDIVPYQKKAQEKDFRAFLQLRIDQCNFEPLGLEEKYSLLSPQEIQKILLEQGKICLENENISWDSINNQGIEKVLEKYQTFFSLPMAEIENTVLSSLNEGFETQTWLKEVYIKKGYVSQKDIQKKYSLHSSFFVENKFSQNFTDSVEKILQLEQDRIFKICDLDQNKTLDHRDLLIQKYRAHGISDREFKLFIEGATWKNKELSFVFPEDIDFQVALEGMAGYIFADILIETSNLSPEKVADFIFKILDANADGFLNRGDDASGDKLASQKDFYTFAQQRKQLLQKYGDSVDFNKIVPADMLFLTYHGYKIKGKAQYGLERTSNNFFQPYFSQKKAEKVMDVKSWRKQTGVSWEKTTEQSSGAGRMFGTGAGTWLGWTLGGPVVGIVGGLLGNGVGRMADGPTRIITKTIPQYTHYKKDTRIQYLKTKTECRDSVINVIVFSLPNEYEIMFLDANKVMTTETETEIVKQYSDGELIKASSNITKYIQSCSYDQNTAGRVVVLHRPRNLRASYDNGQLRGLYYTNLSKSAQVLSSPNAAMKKAFEQAKEEFESSNEYKTLCALTKGVRTFNPKRSLERQQDYLKYYYSKKQDDIAVSYFWKI